MALKRRGTYHVYNTLYPWALVSTHGGDFFLLGLQGYQQLGLLVLHLVHHLHEVIHLVPCGFQQRRLDFRLAPKTRRVQNASKQYFEVGVFLRPPPLHAESAAWINRSVKLLEQVTAVVFTARTMPHRVAW